MTKLIPLLLLFLSFPAFNLRAQQFLSLLGDTVTLRDYPQGALIVVTSNKECTGCLEKLGETLKKISTKKTIIILDNVSVGDQMYRRLRAAKIKKYYPATTQFLTVINDSLLINYDKTTYTPFILFYKNGICEPLVYEKLFNNVFITKVSRKEIINFLK